MTNVITMSIGRSSECDVILEDPSVSRLHAELTLSRHQRLYLTDCDSLSGTYVFRNTEWVAIRQQYIAESDRVRFGDVEMTATKLRVVAFQEQAIKKSPNQDSGFNRPKRNASTGRVEEARKPK